jgi:hypothetical protein
MINTKIMKRLIYLSLFISLILFSCESTPEANFYSDTVEPGVGQDVFFTNNSKNAVNFEWDFGDGSTSTAENPSHIFNGSGTFLVTLKAVSKKGLEDNAELSIEVFIPTLLEIEVREFYDEYIVPNASVIMYGSIIDWDAQTNKVTEGLTDKYGKVVFSGLGPWVYYVDVWEKDHDNYLLRDEDIGFIRTAEVVPHSINRFVAWVDYVQHTKGDARGTRSMVIMKLERKADTKPQAASGTDTQGWEEMYARSVNK